MAGLHELSDTASLRLLDVIEGRLQPSEVSPKIRRVFAVIDKQRKEIAADATKKNLQIKLAD